MLQRKENDLPKFFLTLSFGVCMPCGLRLYITEGVLKEATAVTQ